MPLYQVACAKCEKSQDIYRSLAEYDNLPKCCGQKTYRVMSAPFVRGDYQPYRSMITGQMIEGRAQHREHLKRHNCVEVGNEQPKPRKPVPFDREKRKRQIAEVVNSKL